MNVGSMANSSEFLFKCIGFEDPADIKSPVYVLDTQVVSILESIVVNGFKKDNPNHVRGINFLRRMAASDGGQVNNMLDHLEGSSFHRGTLDSFNVVRRTAAVEMLIGLSSKELTDFADGGAPFLIPVKPRQGEAANKRLDVAISLMDWLFSPAYTVALLARQCSVNGSPDELGDELVRLSSMVPVLPDVPVLSALLLQYATPSLQSELRGALFKFGASDGRKACHSVAWDLAYWGQLDLLDGAARGQDRTDQLPVLVTMDRRLAVLADAIRRPANHFRLEILEQYLRQGTHDAIQRVRAAIAKNYKEASEADNRSAYANVIDQLERDMGFTSTTWSDLRNVHHLSADWPFIRTVLDVILGEWGRLIEVLTELANQGHNVLLSSLYWAELLMAENARAHGREVAESLVAFFGPEKRDSKALLDGERLILAASEHGGDGWLFNAMLRELSMQPERINYAAVGIVGSIRSIIEDIAVARGATAERIVEVLKHNIDTRPIDSGTDGR